MTLLSSNYSNRGKCNHAIDNPKEAIKDYNSAVKKAIEYANNRELHRKDGQYKSKIDPKIAEYFSNRAEVWLDAGYYEKAIEDYNSCLVSLA